MKSFYELSKEERRKLVARMEHEIEQDIETGEEKHIILYASDRDTYVRKNAYLILGRLYRNKENLRGKILEALKNIFHSKNEKVRQTAVYAAGEIGKIDADNVMGLIEKALKDESNAVRNAVVGALKQMGATNSEATLAFARKFLHHSNPKVRKRIIHGIELRGRTHPENILPLLAELQNDRNKEVKNMIIHVLGQISYKKGCLEKVISALKMWKNKDLVKKAIIEILDVHRRYEKFSTKSYEEAKRYIEKEMK